MTQRIAFIGGGNMATSLIGGLLARGIDPGQITVADPIAVQRDSLQRRFGVSVEEDGPAAAANAGTIVLAVKPQQMADVARGLASVVAERRPLVISIAAGIRLEDLARWLGARVRRSCVRCRIDRPWSAPASRPCMPMPT